MVIKKSVILCFLLCSFSLSAQDQTLNESQIIELFSEINKTDGSHLKERTIRQQFFLRNFDTIIWLIEHQGFPKLSDKKYKKKDVKSINNGAQRTFIHILQFQPEILLNEKTILLIKKEIENNRLDSKLLKIALQTFQYDRDVRREEAPNWNKEIEENFYFAFREWGIKLYSE